MMNEAKSPMVFVKPKEGARIRQPDRNMRILPDDGDFVSTDDTFYSRMISSGDLIISEKKQAEKHKADTFSGKAPRPRE